MERKSKLKRIKYSLAFILLMFLSTNMLAQQNALSGLVKDETGEAIIGASVSVKGTTNGVATDVDGHFVLSNIKQGATILISSVTYISQEITYTGQKELIITLKEDTKLLDEVVVIGYGQVRVKDATGALSSVKADATVRGFAPNAQDMLVGKVSGVNIISEGGSPNGNATIRIRGGSSLSASNDPLIVIDGVFIDNVGINGAGNILSTINPSDIESYTILKDASATAIYGSRASNGVILITTKKGTEGRTRIMYEGNVSIGKLKKQIDVLSGDQFRTFMKDEFSLSSPSVYQQMKTKQGLTNTNWQDEIFQTTFNTEHNLSLYGSLVKNLPYRVSFSYSNIDGILKTSKAERYTGNFSLTPSLFNDHLKVSVTGRGMYAKNRFADWSAIGAAVVMDPSQAVYDKDSPYGGYFSWVGQDNKIVQVATKNPVSMLEMVKDQADVYNFIGNAQIDYKLYFFPDLRVNMNIGLDYSKSDGTKYISEFAPSDYSYGGYDSNWDERKRNTLLNTYLQYDKDFSFLDSHFDIMGGYEWQRYWRTSNSIGYRITQFDTNGDPILVTKGHGEVENYLISFFGRLNYNILNKYLFTFTLRNDGSSRFAKANRWALFPAASLAWRMNEEAFIKKIDVISNMKLRLGWGITGQQNINQDYAHLATYLHTNGDQANYLRGFDEDGNPIWVSLLRPEAYNPDLKWESTTTQNIGLDYGLFNNRIDGSIDVYHRKTKDLINERTKTTAGTNFKEYVVQNIGNLTNTGVEFSINGRIFDQKDFSWQVGANFAYNKNKITKLTAGDDKDTRLVSGVVVNMVGYSSWMYYVYEQIYDDNGKPIEGMYKDQNNDGIINDDDLRPYKKAAGDWTFGLNTKLNWKAWDLSIAGHGSLGNYNYNQIAASNAALSPTSIYNNESLSNRVNSAFDSNFQLAQPLSDYYVQNASFFRIDNIVLGWSFNKSKLLPISGRLFTSVQNPFVFTRYKGLDPEIFGGVDGSLYPRPITYLFGVNLNF